MQFKCAQTRVPINLKQAIWITKKKKKKMWKILQEMGISDHLTSLLRNPYAGQEATGRTGHRTAYWYQIGKGVCQGCILSLCLFSLYVEYIMWNARLNHKWNQDCQEKYQEPQICRWYHSNGRKQRGRDSLVERRKWKRRVKKLT